MREREREPAAKSPLRQPPVQLTQEVGQLLLRQCCKFPFGQAGANYQQGVSEEEHHPKHFPPGLKRLSTSQPLRRVGGEINSGNLGARRRHPEREKTKGAAEGKLLFALRPSREGDRLTDLPPSLPEEGERRFPIPSPVPVKGWGENAGHLRSPKGEEEEGRRACVPSSQVGFPRTLQSS